MRQSESVLFTRTWLSEKAAEAVFENLKVLLGSYSIKYF